MKNSTVFTVIASWFAVLFAVAFFATNPEMFAESGTHTIDGHGVYGSINNLTAIIALAVPTVALGLTVTISYVWHKETKSTKALA